MAIEWICGGGEGFSAALNKQFFHVGGGVSVSVAGSDRGADYINFGQGFTVPVAGSTTKGAACRLSYNFAFGGTHTPFTLREGAVSHIYVYVYTNGEVRLYQGATQLDTTGAGYLSTNTEYHFELEATIHNSTGEARVWIDGVLALEFGPGDTRNGGVTGEIDNVFFSNSVVGGGYGLDFFIKNHLGQVGVARVDTVFPVADGDHTDFGGSYTNIDDTTGPDTGTTNDSQTVNDKDSFVMGPLPALTGETVLATRVCVGALKDDAGPRNMRPILRSVTTDGLGVVFGWGALTELLPFYVNALYLTDPATGSAWASSAAVEAAQPGYELSV